MVSTSGAKAAVSLKGITRESAIRDRFVSLAGSTIGWIDMHFDLTQVSARQVRGRVCRFCIASHCWCAHSGVGPGDLLAECLLAVLPV